MWLLRRVPRSAGHAAPPAAGIHATTPLGGVAVVDLPLYGSERLVPLKEGALIVVTEGEKAADALLVDCTNHL